MKGEKLPSDMIVLVAEVQVLVVRGVANVAVTHEITPVNFLGLLAGHFVSGRAAVRNFARRPRLRLILRLLKFKDVLYKNFL